MTKTRKNTCKIKVGEGDQERELFPEKISALVLQKLAECAKLRNGGKKVVNCVVTVPAYYNNIQKEATMDACNIAGLNCVQLLCEPTAAAIAYGLDIGVSNEESQCVIFDFGGGTFDVTVLSLQGQDIKVKSTNGDPHLGG